MSEKTLIDFLDEFAEALRLQLEFDQTRWGDTWKHRPLLGQEERIFARYKDYMDRFRYSSVPVPWIMVAGNALIAWVREKHPEELELSEDAA